MVPREAAGRQGPGMAAASLLPCRGGDSATGLQERRLPPTEEQADVCCCDILGEGGKRLCSFFLSLFFGLFIGCIIRHGGNYLL